MLLNNSNASSLRGVKLPTLLYHNVSSSSKGADPRLTISVDEFEREVRWLTDQGFVGIRPSDWSAWRRDGAALPPKPVLITFDDAHQGVAQHALPILRRYDFSAAVFVVTAHIGGTNAWDHSRGCAIGSLMSDRQIRDWAANGIEFGAHSRTHPDLRSLKQSGLMNEVIGSRDELADLLGAPVISFAYPYGFVNHAVRECVRSAFEIAFTTRKGLNTASTDPHLLRRLEIYGGCPAREFALRIRLGYHPTKDLYPLLEQTAGRIFGRITR